MMMQAMSATGYSNTMFQQSSKLTDEQAEGLTEILENYDSSDLSDDDAKDLVDQIKELGITAGSDLTSALSDVGIDARSLAEQAGIGGASGPGGTGATEGGEGPPPPPPPPQDTQGVSSLDESLVELIAETVESYTESDDEEDTLWSTVSSALEDAGYDTTQTLIDFYA